MGVIHWVIQVHAIFVHHHVARQLMYTEEFVIVYFGLGPLECEVVLPIPTCLQSLVTALGYNNAKKLQGGHPARRST